MTEQLTAAQIVKMIHPDLPPATAHFLLNEAKPLLELIEAQAAELANYKQLAALQCEDELPELPTMQEVRFSGHRKAHSFYDADDMQAYARQAQAMIRAKMVPLTAEQISDAVYKADAQHNIEFMTADWSVIFTRAIESAHGITGEHKLPAAITAGHEALETQGEAAFGMKLAVDDSVPSGEVHIRQAGKHVGTIGHIGTGKATLTAALVQALSAHPQASEPAPSKAGALIGCVQHDCADCKARAAQPAQGERAGVIERLQYVAKNGVNQPMRDLAGKAAAFLQSTPEAGPVGELTDEQLVSCIEKAGYKTWDSRMWALMRSILAAARTQPERDRQ